MSHKLLQRKVQITGKLTFDTVFHIGSGKEGDLATDMGVLKDWAGRAVLPGSSLKGNFRAMAERLASYLNLTACCLDSQLSGVNCVSDQDHRKIHLPEFHALNSEPEKINWLGNHTCDICRLFGSPLQTSRIFFSDAELLVGGEFFEIRDGVVLDRDSQTARHGLKYDFEVAPAGAVYSISIDLENPADAELGLVGAVLQEWKHGFRLGGFSSRGLGKVSLSELQVSQVDYSNLEQFKDFLLKRKMTPAENLLTGCLEQILAN